MQAHPKRSDICLHLHTWRPVQTEHCQLPNHEWREVNRIITRTRVNRFFDCYCRRSRRVLQLSACDSATCGGCLNVEVQAFAYGSAVFTYLVFAINTASLLFGCEEAIRTRGLGELLHCDFTDPHRLIISDFVGGHAMAQLGIKGLTDFCKLFYNHASPDIGSTYVALHDHYHALLWPWSIKG